MIQAFDGYVMRSGEKLIKKASTKHVNSVSEAIEDVLKD
jgi:ribosomal protein L19